MKLKVIPEKCNGCGICVDACPFASIKIEDKCAKILDTCTDCGACVDVCTEKAILAEEAEVPVYRNIIVFTTLDDNKYPKGVENLIGIAHELAARTNERVEVVTCCEDARSCEKTMDMLFKAGAEKAYLIEHKFLKEFQPEIYAKVIADFVKSKKPKIFLMPATYDCNELAARVASILDIGVVLNTTALNIDEFEGHLLQTTQIFDAQYDATYLTDGRPQITTVCVSALPQMTFENEARGEIEVVKPELDLSEMKIKKIKSTSLEKEPLTLKNARIVLCCGRGGRNNLNNLNELARMLDAVVCGTKGCVDAKVITDDLQVGITGESVAPDIYIACGVSGAIQHVDAVKNAKLVVAINKDGNAPIFKIADAGIIGDLNDILPAWIEYLKSSRR